MEAGLMLGMMFAGVGIPVAAWGIWDSWLKHREKALDYQHSRKVEQLTNEKAQMQDRMEMMEDRLAVLERIATDPATRTAREIEDLR